MFYRLKTFIKRYKKQLSATVIVCVGLLLFALLTKATHILVGTDDAVLSQAMHHYSVFTWVPHQYKVWSGRVTAESLIVLIYNLPLWVWKVLQVLSFGVFILMLYKYYKIVSRKSRNDTIDLVMLAVCTFAPLLIAEGALRWGAFWITGSLNYLWIAVLGLVAYYPILYTLVHKKSPSWIWVAVGLAAAIFTSMGQEQAYLLLNLASITTVAVLIFETKKIWLYPLIQTILTLVGSVVSYTAPGNHLRFESEMHTYIPNFQSAPLGYRLEWDLRWAIDAIVNHLGYILPVIWVLMILILMVEMRGEKKPTYLKLKWTTVVTLVAALIVVFKVVPDLNMFNFYVAWNVSSFPKVSYIYLLFWIFALTMTLIGLFFTSKRFTKYGLILPSIFCGMLVGIVSMVLSPTMYASGERTMLIPSVVGVILIVILTSYALKEYLKYRLLLASGVIFCALLTFVSLLTDLSEKAKSIGL